MNFEPIQAQRSRIISQRSQRGRPNDFGCSGSCGSPERRGPGPRCTTACRKLHHHPPRATVRGADDQFGTDARRSRGAPGRGHIIDSLCIARGTILTPVFGASAPGFLEPGLHLSGRSGRPRPSGRKRDVAISCLTEAVLARPEKPRRNHPIQGVPHEPGLAVPALIVLPIRRPGAGLARSDAARRPPRGATHTNSRSPESARRNRWLRPHPRRR